VNGIIGERAMLSTADDQGKAEDDIKIKTPCVNLQNSQPDLAGCFLTIYSGFRRVERA